MSCAACGLGARHPRFVENDDGHVGGKEISFWCFLFS